MKPLSERYDAITGQHIINGEIVRKNVTPEVAQLEAENEALTDALNHCGYDPDDCIDCGDSPHNEYCRFWKVRHLLSYWETD